MSYLTKKEFVAQIGNVTECRMLCVDGNRITSDTMTYTQLVQTNGNAWYCVSHHTGYGFDFVKIAEPSRALLDSLEEYCSWSR